MHSGSDREPSGDQAGLGTEGMPCGRMICWRHGAGVEAATSHFRSQVSSFFYKGPDTKYVWLWGPGGPAATAQPSLIGQKPPQVVLSEWAWLRANTALFTETSGPDVA